MSTNDGGPAFPIPGWKDDPDFNGMTLRDYFAGKVVQGFMAGYYSNPESCGWSNEDIAKEGYKLADAMLAARES
ncbi:hypothetical protein N7414_01140 [Pseudomonas sp. GD04087]|uniref:hypothetical protein n=1 Tax=unclassified Pseudomonas TaxID=196821 RepID=UPI002448D625|nr:MULTISPECIES: hypothetical protein [unclassified Pseudomonas]MDH0287703.1 hypothetical protein [Pseudomonas sp. GD04087]MDH1050872.1 hypothetical protein [Pseudomonas sp. GD03903]MDH1999845.1 hypothetical protein [Pseudomonas sp. GD03691]